MLQNFKKKSKNQKMLENDKITKKMKKSKNEELFENQE